MVALSIVPPVFIVASVYGRYIRRISKKVQDSLADSTQVHVKIFIRGSEIVSCLVSDLSFQANAGALLYEYLGGRRKIGKFEDCQSICPGTKGTGTLQRENH